MYAEFVPQTCSPLEFSVLPGNPAGAATYPSFLGEVNEVDCNGVEWIDRFGSRRAF
jgi:hypothetical protein